MTNAPPTFTPKTIAYAKEISKKLNARYSTKCIKLLALIYGDGSCHQHFSVEQLMEQAKHYRVSISIATLYNTIRILVQKGFLNEIMLPFGQRMFDTNITDHQHYYNLHTRKVHDLTLDIPIRDMITPPQGTVITDVKLTASIENT